MIGGVNIEEISKSAVFHVHLSPAHVQFQLELDCREF